MEKTTTVKFSAIGQRNRTFWVVPVALLFRCSCSWSYFLSLLCFCHWLALTMTIHAVARTICRTHWTQCWLIWMGLHPFSHSAVFPAEKTNASQPSLTFHLFFQYAFVCNNNFHADSNNNAIVPLHGQLNCLINCRIKREYFSECCVKFMHWTSFWWNFQTLDKFKMQWILDSGCWTTNLLMC